MLPLKAAIFSLVHPFRGELATDLLAVVVYSARPGPSHAKPFCLFSTVKNRPRFADAVGNLDTIHALLDFHFDRLLNCNKEKLNAPLMAISVLTGFSPEFFNKFRQG